MKYDKYITTKPINLYCVNDHACYDINLNSRHMVFDENKIITQLVSKDDEGATVLFIVENSLLSSHFKKVETDE